MTVPAEPGCVYVVATPIGNLEDASPRVARTLREVSLIACEDTRRTARLCSHLGIGTRRVSLHAHNERSRLPQLLERLRAGDSIALVSDAGTPLLSDPGARLVAAALEAGARVVPIPGPSALLAALIASGLPVQPFTFVGFLPRKGSARRAALEQLTALPGTLVLFEAPTRVAATLADLGRALGPRHAAVTRELTKRFEEVLRGRLGELVVPELRGEVTLVIGPPDEARPASPDEADEPERLADALLQAGASARDAAQELARRTPLTRSQAYRLLLARRNQK